MNILKRLLITLVLTPAVLMQGLSAMISYIITGRKDDYDILTEFENLFKK